jgi:hypothetical protein
VPFLSGTRLAAASGVEEPACCADGHGAVTELPALLQKWEKQWRLLGSDVDTVLRPGLSAQAVTEQLTASVGPAHEDLVNWFSWHDGSQLESAWIAAPTGRQILPLQGCLRLRDQMLRIKSEPESDVELPRWDPRWLPLTDNKVGAVYAVDTVTGSFLSVDWWDADFVSTHADGLSGAVAAWVQALQGGYYEWAEDHWEYDFAALPASLRTTGLVG